MNRLVVLLAAFAIGCSSPTAPVATGDWGGTEASLTLSRAGGSVSLACGAANIDSTWTLLADGTFDATGEYFSGGGPVPIGGRPPHPAHFTGTVAGTRFTFSIHLTDLNQTLGPFHLVRGGPPVYEQCV